MKKDNTNEKMYVEYELFSLACPHFNELQNLVGDTIKKYFSKENRQDLQKEWTQHYLDDNQKHKVMFESIAIKQMKNLGFKEVKNIFREQMEATIIAIK
mgnify:CR=1 FL=1